MKYFHLTLLFALVLSQSFALSILKGKVIEAGSGKPVPGATIALSGSSLTAVADADGLFSLQTNGAAIELLVRSIGYEQTIIQVKAPYPQLLAITLNAGVTELREVQISTGYQTIPRERSTGSFTTIENRLFNQQVGPDVLSRLPAIANGLTVDRTTSGQGNLLVRGLSTINGPKSPLIILDNFSYEGTLENLNPNTIESISILKDAAAASIWGARAGNGVIVITTRKGRYNQPLTADFNVNMTVSQKPDLGYLRQMSSGDFIDVEHYLFDNSYYDSWINDPNRPPLSPVVTLLQQVKNGVISQATADQELKRLRQIDIRDDFDRYLYKPAFNQQYALNLRGGNEELSWSTFAGYDHLSDQLNAVNDRLSLRYQNTYRPVKALQLSSSLLYTQTKSNSGRPGYGAITSVNNSFLPYTALADANGNSLPVIKDYDEAFKSGLNAALQDWSYYPLNDYHHQTSRSMQSDLLVNAGLNYLLLPGLSADLKYQYERQNGNDRQLADRGSYFARSMVNRYAQTDASGTISFPIPAGGILDLGDHLMQSHQFRAQLGYDHTWGLHQLNAIGGYEMRNNRTTSSLNRFYGYNDNNLTYGNVDYVTQYPDFVHGGLASIPDNRGLGELTARFISYFANANYTFNSRYSLSLSGRRDASNLFGLNTNEQWNPFWSAGAGWEVSQEKFYQIEALPYLKFRATYGFSGNIDPSMVAVSTIAYLGSNSLFTNTPMARFDHYYNPELRWETSKMLNFGLDFRLAQDRLTGSIEYYRKYGRNLFGTALIDYTAGVGVSIQKNVASMNGSGVDVELRSINTRGRVNWTTLLNFSYYRDKVTQYYQSSLQGSNFITNTSVVPVSGLTGYPVYSLFAYRWAGLDHQTGDPIGYLNGAESKDYAAITGNGTQASDLKYFGSAIPTKFGSVINNFSCGPFAFSFSVAYKFGYFIRRNSIHYSNLFASWQTDRDFANRWKVPGDESHTNVPSMTYPADIGRDNFYNGSEVLVEKGDHVRLQFVNLSYEIRKQGSGGRMPFKSVQFYINASNLGVLWRANKSGIDPDYNYGLYPLVSPRTLSLGVKTTF